MRSVFAGCGGFAVERLRAPCQGESGHSSILVGGNDTLLLYYWRNREEQSSACSFASAERRLLLHADKLLLCCDAPCTGPAGVPFCSDERDKLHALAGQPAGNPRGLLCGRKSFGGAWATAGVHRNGFCHRSVVKPASFVYALQPCSYSPKPQLDVLTRMHLGLAVVFC